LHQGNLDVARYFFEQNQRIDTELQFWDGIAESWRNLGYVYREEGKSEQASQCLENCVRVCLEHALDKSEAFYTAGFMALACYNYAMALRRLTHQLNLARRPDRQSTIGPLLLGLAAVAAGTNQPERAAKLYGAAQALFEITGDRTPMLDRAEFDRHTQIARRQLGEAAFEALAAAGHALPSEQAIDLALQAAHLPVKS
jgi:tetratricopeptide (TPR) repeat protein